MRNKLIGSTVYSSSFVASQPSNQSMRLLSKTSLGLPSNLWELTFEYAVEDVNIELNWEGSNLDLYLYDPIGKLIQRDTSGEKIKKMSAGQLQINLTYYILVRGITETTYELTVSYYDKARQQNAELHFNGISQSNIMMSEQNFVIDSTINYPKIKLANIGTSKIQQSKILLRKMGEEETHFIHNCFELQQGGEILIDLYPMDEGQWNIIFESSFILADNNLTRSQLLVSLFSYPNPHTQLSQSNRNIPCDGEDDPYFWWLAMVILAAMCCLPVTILIVRNCYQRIRQRRISIQQQSHSQRRNGNDNEPNRYLGLFLQLGTNKEKKKQQEQSKHWLQDQKSRNSQCPVCLQDNCNCQLVCKHRFHMHCILEWIHKYKSCPYCRLRASKQQVRLLD